MSERFIVEVHDGIEPWTAFAACQGVAHGGRVSETERGKQHCFLTVFHEEIQVACIKRGKSERFIVSKTPRVTT